MVAAPPPALDTRVLAIASQVVSGYVGNSTTTFVLQLLGHETAQLNTVQFSNHSGYRQKNGTVTSAETIQSLWDGLKMNGLHAGFGMILSGYVPTAAALEVVGKVVKEIKSEDPTAFWLLDPVMGDQGRLYVSDEVVPVYKSLLPHADLIVPNQFEAELLSGVHIDSLATLSQAIDTLHATYGTPHIVITSVTFPGAPDQMFCAGSTLTPGGTPRKFIHDIEVMDGFFSGTGDLFAALTLARLREQAAQAGLLHTPGWRSGEGVPAEELPLAKAIGGVLASMQGVLRKTREARERNLKGVDLEGMEEKQRIITRARASELRLVQCQAEILVPGVGFVARRLE